MAGLNAAFPRTDSDTGEVIYVVLVVGGVLVGLFVVARKYYID